MGKTVTHYVEVNAPAQACYDWWRPLTRLPEILSDVTQVRAKDNSGRVTEWTVSGPAGKQLHWDAEIVDDRPPHTIAWRTADSADADVANSGVVRFEDKGNGLTGVEISLSYDPPAGKLGEAVAALFSDPQRKVERAAHEFKTVMENR
jgi:uncharacterized membrane protein